MADMLISAEKVFERADEVAFMGFRAEERKTHFMSLVSAILEQCTTVDAVDVDDMREFAKDVAYQFGYYCQNRGRLHITHGGLSTLEEAFDILGWENPHPVPECECEIDGCHEHATCGAPTNDGYKRMCGKHCRERSINGKID